MLKLQSLYTRKKDTANANNKFALDLKKSLRDREWGGGGPVRDIDEEKVEGGQKKVEKGDGRDKTKFSRVINKIS